MKKSRLFLLYLCVFVLSALLSACSLIDSNETEVPETIPENVYGVPGDMYTIDDDFKVTLKHIESNQTFTVEEDTTYNDMFDYNFHVPEPNPEIELPPETPLQPGEMWLEVELESDNRNIFVFGSVNDSEKELYFDDCRLIFISFEGNADWELCGIRTDMTKEEVVSVLGKPTQELQAETGLCYEYYKYQDGHSYMIMILFNSDGSDGIYKMLVNIDNHPVFQ